MEKGALCKGNYVKIIALLQSGEGLPDIPVNKVACGPL